MPTFDGGHYFLTALIPVRAGTIEDEFAATSPVHALSKRLAMLPTAAESPACQKQKSPFARNTRTHFARLVIIDDVAYNGREQGNTLLSLGEDLIVAQPQDHLSCPYLLFAADFDAKNGSDAERDSYLTELWTSMGAELRDIFRFCQGFDSNAQDRNYFAKYIAGCQIETTMSFNDYYIDPLNLPTWPIGKYKWLGIACFAIFALGLAAALALFIAELFAPPWLSGLRYAVAATVLGGAALGILILAIYASIMAAGAKPFPAAPDSDLRTVLKSLHLQRTFTRFAIDNQIQVDESDAAFEQRLHKAFATFLAVNNPDNLDQPTQQPGVIGI